MGVRIEDLIDNLSGSIFKSSLQLCCGVWIREGKTNQEAKYRYQMVKPGFGEGTVKIQRSGCVSRIGLDWC